MKQFLPTMIAAIFLAAGAARAQESWVQIEAQPTLERAEERAQAWASALPEVNGFRLTSGWYAVTLGPYPAELARDRLFALRGEGLIPPDSFLSDGGNYTGRFWPSGAAPAAAAAKIRTVVAAAGGHTTLFRAGADGAPQVPRFDAQSPAIEAITRRLRTEFDPAGVFNRGRMG